ncbi:MAG: hypothetical protein DVB33_10185 [Verrucomicrobia bacterium]|nr:MAG: hypothetical protein DVB33_10185 [Verrucomicrobiota bacterium]
MGRLVRVEKSAKGLGRGCETVGGDELRGAHPGPIVSQDRDAIESHLGELDAETRKWLRRDIPVWRTGGGFRQWRVCGL